MSIQRGFNQGRHRSVGIAIVKPTHWAWKRGAFNADEAERQMVGLMALLPQVVDAVSVPVVATGGIADARGVAAALILGASAVQIGTGFLRSPEVDMPAAYADRLAHTEADDTRITRAFSGRPGRSAATAYVRAAGAPGAPPPAPYPVQRGLLRQCARRRRKPMMRIACSYGRGRRPSWRRLNRWA